MTKDELITKQQLEIEQYKQDEEENRNTLRSLEGMFYSIGAPLNDNILKFNNDQLKWCFKTYDLIERL